MLEQFTHLYYPRNWALIATILDAGTEKEFGAALDAERLEAERPKHRKAA